mmetsp:Transcript_9504/g.19456  ORF Transcript_9504/g.19456 Transcript_9504/m.19456 type:complete len:84 (-) Transcript_9504:1066-1317(-)
MQFRCSLKQGGLAHPTGEEFVTQETAEPVDVQVPLLELLIHERPPRAAAEGDRGGRMIRGRVDSHRSVAASVSVPVCLAGVAH